MKIQSRCLWHAVFALVVTSACSAASTSGPNEARPVEPTFAKLDVSPDMGYSVYPQVYADVNADGFDDYCRFVGDEPAIFLSCKLGSADGFVGDDYAFNSVEGLDRGYDGQPRGMGDVNGDGRADYCRFVGDAPDIFLSCNLAGENGFEPDQYGFNSISALDPGA